MHILIAEDDPKLGPLVQYKLKREAHSADLAADMESAASYIEMGSYDLYILDWMLPGGSGIDLCRTIRAQQDYTPILMLTARDAVKDRVTGLKSGADDYLIKPFAFDELLARVTALGRRRDVAWQDEVLAAGDLKLNTDTYEVYHCDQFIQLTRREFQLLEYMMRNAGQILSRERIVDQVWGMDAEVTPNAVDAMIRLLRKKVDKPFGEKRIQSIRGIGYTLKG